MVRVNQVDRANWKAKEHQERLGMVGVSCDRMKKGSLKADEDWLKLENLDEEIERMQE
jgi:hypothetical protein